jgi:hypothetical protein
MVGMRDSNPMPADMAGQGPWQEQHVQFARGHWRREEHAGAIRSAGWWESVTVTWRPAATRPRRSPLLAHALATAWETIGPLATELAVAAASRLLDRRHRPPAPAPPPHRRLHGAMRALPHPDQAP